MPWLEELAVGSGSANQQLSGLSVAEHGNPLPPARVDGTSQMFGDLMTKTLTGTEHHIAAAEHHERAAQHHRQASKHYAEKDFARAAHQALIAHGHTQQAIWHANEATKYHIEHHSHAGSPS
jgi:hypothetical protein